jgi:hypothetical protein
MILKKRAVLSLAILYALLRIGVQVVYLAVLMLPVGAMPSWAEGVELPVDLQAYLDAAERFAAGVDLYRSGEITVQEGLYQYAPSFAAFSVLFTLIPKVETAIIHTALHVAAYVLLWMEWREIFEHVGLEKARRMMVTTLPLWLVFSAFWTDLAYLNVYIPMALLATALIHTVLREQLRWSVLWLTVILQIKPQWAFVVIVPLLLGRHRFFFRLVGWGTVAYASVVGATVVTGWALGNHPGYIVDQYADYARFLAGLSQSFPWRMPTAPYLGYNHSIKQTIVYLLGDTPLAAWLTWGSKAILLAPLGFVAVRCLRRPAGKQGIEVPRLALNLAFAFYFAAFIVLDVVWEASLSIVIFPYLLTTVERRWVKAGLWAVFVPYALVDAWQLVSFGVWGMGIMDPGPYILTDPSIYVPLTMMVIVAFYGATIDQLLKVERKQC